MHKLSEVTRLKNSTGNDRSCRVPGQIFYRETSKLGYTFNFHRLLQSQNKEPSQEKKNILIASKAIGTEARGTEIVVKNYKAGCSV